MLPIERLKDYLKGRDPMMRQQRKSLCKMLLLKESNKLLTLMFLSKKKISVLKKQLQEVGAAFMGARSDAFENALSVKAFANEEAENKFMLKSRLPLLALYMNQTKSRHPQVSAFYCWAFGISLQALPEGHSADPLHPHPVSLHAAGYQ